MGFFKLADSAAGRMGWLDFGLVKVAVFAFALLLAKSWPALLSLDWYWYALVAVLASLPPFAKASRK